MHARERTNERTVAANATHCGGIRISQTIGEATTDLERGGWERPARLCAGLRVHKHKHMNYVRNECAPFDRGCCSARGQTSACVYTRARRLKIDYANACDDGGSDDYDDGEDDDGDDNDGAMTA